MSGWQGNIRVYAYCAPVNMSKGFEGLSGLVRNELGRDPLSGKLFLFTNRRCNYVKVLFFGGSGMCIFAKRIEKRRFGALWDFSRSKELMLTKSELDLWRQLFGEPSERRPYRARRRPSPRRSSAATGRSRGPS